MVRKSIETPPGQMGFGEAFGGTKNLSEVMPGNLRGILQILQKDRIWGNPVGDGIFTDLTEGSDHGYVFDGSTLQIRHSFYGGHPVDNKKYSILIVAVSSDRPGLEHLGELLNQMALNSKLRKSTPLFIIETNPDVEGDYKINRKRLLSSTGLKLIKKDIVIHDGFIIWKARLPDQVRRQPFDIIEKLSQSEEPWKRFLISDKKARVAKAMFNAGFNVLNTAAIDGLLRRVINVPHAFALLDMGCGIRLEAHDCGCIWDIPLSGDAVKVQPCAHGSGCQTPWPELIDITGKYIDEKSPLTKKRAIIQAAKESGGFIKLGQDCIDCGSHNAMVRTMFEWGEVRPGVFKFQTDTYCIHCGNPVSKYEILDTNEIS